MNVPTIIEVIGRSEQGRSEPFICRADDGFTYYVKGLHAGRESQIKEWLCARLAERFGLPIAPFSIVDVPETLIRARLRPDLAALGSGPAFGSRKIEAAVWLDRSHLRNIPLALQRDVLAFDWWIRNADRTLSEHGGNPNLLWDAAVGKLVVIDHNLAFDTDFNEHGFLSEHVFSAAAASLFEDFLRSADTAARLVQTLSAWDAVVAELPPEWRFNDPEQTLLCRFDIVAAHDRLARAANENFWSVRS